MRITDLNITNYRNIISLDYHPGRKINIITGKNGQGKTNLIEAIFVLATGYSFRPGSYQNLLCYQKPKFLLKAKYECKDREIESRLEYFNQKARFEINNKKTNHKNKDRVHLVIFNPDDLYIIKGNPGQRRYFIDFALKQISLEYEYNLDKYNKILKKRNLLLKKEQTNNRTFSIVNQLFIENACNIIITRVNFVNQLDEILKRLFEEIGYTDTDIPDVKVRYAVSFPIDSAKINLDILYRSLEQHITASMESEKRRKTSLYGPHVDDLNIYYNGKLARYFASQGQQRTLAVSLKLSEIYTFKKIEGFYPIFLLDEVLAELDATHQQRLLDYLQKAEFQSFLTSVNTLPLDGADVITLENGSIRKKG